MHPSDFQVHDVADFPLVRLMPEGLPEGYAVQWEAEMEALIRECGRVPQQRSTAYGDVGRERIKASFEAAALTPPVNEVATAYERKKTAPSELVRPGFE